MNFKAELKILCALSGPAGYEQAVSEKVEALFSEFCQEKNAAYDLCAYGRSGHDGAHHRG